MAALGRFRFSHAILLSILVYGSSLTTTAALADDSSSTTAAAIGGDAAHTNLRRRLQLPALQKTFKARGAPPTPLPECEGDCDRDSHCAEGLTCFQR